MARGLCGELFSQTRKQLGFANAAVAAGMEGMERAPYLLGSCRRGYRMGDAPIYDSVLRERDGLVNAYSDKHSGWHTEDLASKLDVLRDRQNRWARQLLTESSTPNSCQSIQATSR